MLIAASTFSAVLLDRRGRLRRLARKGGSGGAAHAEARIVEHRDPETAAGGTSILRQERLADYANGSVQAARRGTDFGNPRQMKNLKLQVCLLMASCIAESGVMHIRSVSNTDFVPL